MTEKKTVGVVGPRGAVIGEDHHNAKLADWQVEHIRMLYETGQFGYRKIAKMSVELFGVQVSKDYVRDVVKYRRRACVPDRHKTVDGAPSVYDRFTRYDEE